MKTHFFLQKRPPCSSSSSSSSSSCCSSIGSPLTLLLSHFLLPCYVFLSFSSIIHCFLFIFKWPFMSVFFSVLLYFGFPFLFNVLPCSLFIARSLALSLSLSSPSSPSSVSHSSSSFSCFIPLAFLPVILVLSHRFPSIVSFVLPLFLLSFILSTLVTFSRYFMIVRLLFPFFFLSLFFLFLYV